LLGFISLNTLPSWYEASPKSFVRLIHFDHT
jgi:hypothetical protein